MIVNIFSIYINKIILLKKFICIKTIKTLNKNIFTKEEKVLLPKTNLIKL